MVPATVADEVVEEIIPVVQEDASSNIYGHDYFTSKGLSIIPSYNAPAPASYVLGPGDEIIIDLWGNTVSHIIATIGNDGAINVDNLGPVYLNGLNVKNAEKLLKSELGRIFSGLREDGTGDTFLRLSVGKIKGVGINILGEVVTPGMYTIPSLSSITSAIFMAGGVRTTGSVRNINLYRNGKKVSTFDLYDFIFKGKYDENLRLQDNDLLTVDAYNNIVSIDGAVIRPMRYEMKKGQTVQDLLDYARGFSTHADRGSVHVVRRNVSTTGQAYDVPSGQFGSFKLEDGDVVTVRSNPDLYDNRVSISGPVMYPGSYAISGNLKDVASLIRTAGGLREGAYELRGQITRLDEKRLPVFISFDLQKVLKGEEYIELAFKYANEADPDAEFYYNDYNTALEPKQSGIVRLLDQLMAEGNIDGYGFQMHHSVGFPSMSQIKVAVERIEQLGLRLRVSELDVGTGSNTEASFTRQAKKYADIMKLLIRYSDQFEAVQVWGLNDQMSWRSKEYPLLFDGKNNPKPAFWAVADPDSIIE